MSQWIKKQNLGDLLFSHHQDRHGDELWTGDHHVDFHHIRRGLFSENKLLSMKFSRSDSRVKMWRFSEVSGNNSVPIFRVLLVVWQNRNNFDSNKPADTTWRWGQCYLPKTFTSWRCCLAEKISLNSVVAKASRLTTSGYIREESIKSYALK